MTDLVARARAVASGSGLDPATHGFERLAGGMSHTVLSPIDDPALVVKVFTSAARQEPEREWEALVALSGSGIAPEPVHVDAGGGAGDPAVVVMTMAGGASSPASELGEEHARAIGAVHRRVHDVDPPTRRPQSHAWLRAAGASLQADVPATDHGPEAPVDAAWSAARRWVGDADVERILSGGEPCFSRGDPNLTNYLWSDGRLVLVDWENSGHSDPVLELADFAEHASTRALTDGFLTALADATGLTAEHQARLLDARRLLACFWLVLIATRERSGLPTTVTAEDQAQRTLTVLGR